jgi:beta-glucoside kinase
MDEKGIMLHSRSIPTPVLGQEKTFSALAGIIRAYQRDFDIQGAELSIPGAAVCDSGYIHCAGTVKDIEHKSIKEELSSLQLPIEFDNNANCAAFAEKRRGNARECQNFVCFTAAPALVAVFLLMVIVIRFGRRVRLNDPSV